MYEKAGRLKPDSVNDLVRVIGDDQGDIGMITREDLVELLSGFEPQPRSPNKMFKFFESNIAKVRFRLFALFTLQQGSFLNLLFYDMTHHFTSENTQYVYDSS